MADRVLCPDRPRLAAAKVVLLDWSPDPMVAQTGDLLTDDPAEAWERLALRDVIPLSAVDDDQRRFACCYGRGRPPCDECDECDDRGTLAHPDTVAACLTLASAWPAVVTAEAIAREIAARVDHPAARIVWRVVPRGEYLETARARAFPWGNALPHQLTPLDDVRGIASAMLDAPGREPRDVQPDPRWWRNPRNAAMLTDAGRACVEPLLALVALGVALDALTDDAIALVMPALGGDHG